MTVNLKFDIKPFLIILLLGILSVDSLILKRQKLISPKQSTPIINVSRSKQTKTNRMLKDIEPVKKTKKSKPGRKNVLKYGASTTSYGNMVKYDDNGFGRGLHSCNSHATNELFTIGLVVLIIYMMFHNATGAALLFTLPIFLAVYSKLFTRNRQLHNTNHRCRSLRMLMSHPDETFFENRKRSVAKFLRDNKFNRKLKLNKYGLYGIAKRYFQNTGEFNGTGWMKNLKLMAGLIFDKQNMVNQVLGLVGR